MSRSPPSYRQQLINAYVQYMDAYNAAKESNSCTAWTDLARSHQPFMREHQIYPSNWDNDVLCENAASMLHERIVRKHAFLSLTKEQDRELFVQGRVTVLGYDGTRVTLTALRPPSSTLLNVK